MLGRKRGEEGRGLYMRGECSASRHHGRLEQRWSGERWSRKRVAGNSGGNRPVGCASPIATGVFIYRRNVNGKQNMKKKTHQRRTNAIIPLIIGRRCARACLALLETEAVAFSSARLYGRLYCCAFCFCASGLRHTNIPSDDEIELRVISTTYQPLCDHLPRHTRKLLHAINRLSSSHRPSSTLLLSSTTLEALSLPSPP